MFPEKTERNKKIVLMFQNFKTKVEIAKKYKIGEAVVRVILLRYLGKKEYMKIRKQRIAMTAVRYPKGYLEKRITYYGKI